MKSPSSTPLAAAPRRSTLLAAFTDHPASVGETYWQHMGSALGFAGWMALAMLAALVHGIFPWLCTRTGSRIVTKLHERMVTHRARAPKASAGARP